MCTQVLYASVYKKHDKDMQVRPGHEVKVKGPGSKHWKWVIWEVPVMWTQSMLRAVEVFMVGLVCLETERKLWSGEDVKNSAFAWFYFLERIGENEMMGRVAV